MPSNLQNIPNLELNDDKLRQKLKEYGINAGPITQTTRSVYLKKLQKVMQEGGDLDQDLNIKQPIIKTSTPISNAKLIISNDPPKTVTPNRSTMSKITVIPPTPSPPSSINKQSKSPVSLFHSTLNEDNLLKDKKAAKFAAINSNKRLLENPQNISSKSNESLEFPPNTSHNISDVINEHLHNPYPSLRSRIGNQISDKFSNKSKRVDSDVDELMAYYKPDDSKGKLEKEERDYTNENYRLPFNRTSEDLLSKYREQSKNSTYSKMNPHRSSLSRSLFSQQNLSPLERIRRNMTYRPPYGMGYSYNDSYSNLFKILNFLKYNIKNLINIIILLILISAIIYVANSLSKIYSQDKGTGSIVLKQEDKLKCDDQNTQSVACLQKNKSLLSLQIAKDLYKILSRRAGKYECNYFSGRSRNYTIDEILIYLQAKYPSMPKSQLNEALYSTIEMIIKHPHWGINYSDISGNREVNSPSVVHWLSAQKAAIPLWCKLGRGLSYIISQFLNFLIGLSLVSLIAYALYSYLKYNRAQKGQMYQMIEKATDILRSASQSSNLNSTGNAPYVAIHHVRDRLIPPHKRKQMQGVWERVVDYLSNHDSRVRMESQMIHGEPFEVWRWLPGPNEPNEPTMPPGPAKQSTLPKSWQGPAFDNAAQYGAQGLTECLKIRNMFDKEMETGYDWPDRVRNVILEKCGPTAEVVHMVIDQGSPEGCVYLKCSTPRAAGLAFHALHGWWYDGNLITVKYIRLERYHERFADSVNANAPLRASQTNSRPRL